MIKSLAIFANPNGTGIKQTLSSTVKQLEKQGVQLLLEKTSAEIIGSTEFSSHEEITKKAELALVLGGDGTILNAARIIGDKEIPILPIHMGRMGFMAEIDPKKLDNVLHLALEKKLPLQRRMRLSCDILNNCGEVVHHGHVLNDITFSRGAIARIIEFDVHISGEHINRYRGDGYIISTATGSTGYNLSAGGPVVYPTMEIIILTPICPHSINNRPIIVPADSIITVTLVENRQEIYITQDGQTGYNLKSGESIITCRAPFDTLLCYTPGYSFFGHMKSKFGWGDPAC